MEKRRLFPIYCIDTSALINLSPQWNKDVYRRDVFPTIWEKLESMIKNEKLISSREVYNEIKKRDDAISKWCDDNKKMFKDIDECQEERLKNIGKKYDVVYWDTLRKKEIWADPWLVALSICEDAIIVTDEKNTPNRIPGIAGYFNRQCINLIDFFKNIGIKC